MRRATRFAVSLPAALLCACGAHDGGGGAPAPAPPQAVRTAAAERQPWERTVAAVGRLQADEEATLRAKVPARLVEWRVDMGSPVRAGDVLALQERVDYELRVAQAQALLEQARARVGLPLEGEDDPVDENADPAVAEARSQLALARSAQQRAVQMATDDVLPQADMDRAQATYETAQARLQGALADFRARMGVLAQRRADLALARQQLADCTISAPFDGVVVERQAGRGDFLESGDAVLMMARLDPLRLRAEVPERDAAEVRAGQTVRVRLEGQDEVRSAALERLSPRIGDRNRMLMVEASLPNPSGTDSALRAGAFVSVEIVTDPHAETLVVPEAAIVSFAGLDQAFVVADGKAQERRLRLGRRAGGRAEVLDGLEAGERVVLDPGGLRSGQALQVTE